VRLPAAKVPWNADRPVLFRTRALECYANVLQSAYTSSYGASSSSSLTFTLRVVALSPMAKRCRARIYVPSELLRHFRVNVCAQAVCRFNSGERDHFLREGLGRACWRQLEALQIRRYSKLDLLVQSRMQIGILSANFCQCSRRMKKKQAVPMKGIGKHRTRSRCLLRFKARGIFMSQTYVRICELEKYLQCTRLIRWRLRSWEDRGFCHCAANKTTKPRSSLLKITCIWIGIERLEILSTRATKRNFWKSWNSNRW